MRDLLLTAIVCGLLPFCFTRPWVGFLTWTWLGMMNPHRIVYGFAQGIPWAMLVGVATIAGLLLTRDKKPVPWNFQLVLILVLTAHFALTSVFAWVPDLAWDRLWLCTKVNVMLILTTLVIYGRNRIRWLLMVIALGIGYYGIKGGIWVGLTGGGERVHGPENSFISQSNGIGVGLLMVIPLMFALAREEQRKWLRMCLTAAAALCIISVIFTYSRGAWIGMAATAPFMFLRSKRKLLAAVILVPAIIGVTMWAPDKLFHRAETIEAYEEDQSAMQRIQAWTVAWNIAIESPLLGAGFNFESFPSDTRWLSYADREHDKYGTEARAAHSIYFQMLGQHGFVGLGLFLLLFLSTIWKCKQLQKRTEGNPELEWIGNYASAIRICLIGFMVSGAFISTGYFDLAWIYCSFTALLSREMPAAKPAFARRPPAAPVEQNPGLSGIGSAHRRKAGS